MLVAEFSQEVVETGEMLFPLLARDYRELLKGGDIEKLGVD